jgi:hypothetical protein
VAPTAILVTRLNIGRGAIGEHFLPEHLRFGTAPEGASLRLGRWLIDCANHGDSAG